MNRSPQTPYIPPLPTIELVIFDCDGVLVDSEHVSAEVLANQLQALGLPIDYDYVLTHFLGHSYESMVHKIHHYMHFTLPASFRDHYTAQLMQAFEQRLQSTDGVEQVIASLGVDSCIATSSNPSRTERALQLSGLDTFFSSNVFTADEVQNGKPAPDLFLHAAAEMKVEPARCLVIEDSPAGLTAAKAAGMNVWRYTGGSHLAQNHHDLPPRLAHIPLIASWQMFYTMAPNLKKTGE